MGKEIYSDDIIKLITSKISSEKHTDEEINELTDNILKRAGYKKKRFSLKDFFKSKSNTFYYSYKPEFAVVSLLIIAVAVFYYVINSNSSDTAGQGTEAMELYTTKNDDHNKILNNNSNKEIENSQFEEITKESINLKVNNRALNHQSDPIENNNTVNTAKIILSSILETENLETEISENSITARWKEINNEKNYMSKVYLTAEFDSKKESVIFTEKKQQEVLIDDLPVKKTNFTNTIIKQFKIKYFN